PPALAAKPPEARPVLSSGGPRTVSPAVRLSTPDSNRAVADAPARRSVPMTPAASPTPARPALPSTDPVAPAVRRPKTIATRERESGRPVSAAAPARRPDGRRDRSAHVQREILERLGAELDLGRIDPTRFGDEELWEKAENSICSIVERLEADGA